MLAALAAFAATTAADAADAAERRYTITSFDRIQVDGPFEVTLATGRASSAVATGTTEALERVSIEVQGRTLRIRPNRSAWGGYPGQSTGTLKISLATHELRHAELSGSGSLAIDQAKGLRFDMLVAGSGRISVASVDADNLNVGLLGSGKVTLAGKAKALTATLRGSGDLEAEALVTDEAKIETETAGAITVSVRRAAKVTSTGAGDTRIIGKPACTVKALGSGAISCGS